MSNEIKYYFLVPGYDFPANSVTLGSIITDLTQPHDAYFTAEEGDIDPKKIMPTDKYDFSETVTDKSAKKAGLFGRFLNVVHVGAEASVQFDQATNKLYTFKHMHTEWFEPTKALLDKAVKSGRVADYLRDTDFQEPVYMVTGVKTVMGVSVATFNSKGRGVVVMLGVDASAAGAPMSMGPKYEDNVERTQAAMFKDSSAIVFAFRLKEIRCVEGKIKPRDMTGVDGALFGAGKQNVDISIGSTKDEFVEADLEGSEVATERVVDEEDESDCIAIMPRS